MANLYAVSDFLSWNITLKITEIKDNKKISQRLKQINIAKNTIGYERYIGAVGKHERNKEFNLSWHPSTPDVTPNISKSCFTGRLRDWKLRLHLWGNLEEHEYNYIIEKNLKLPPNISKEKPKLHNKACFEESMANFLNSNSHKTEKIDDINLSELRISPINFSEKDFILDALNMKSKFRIKGARISQMHSVALSNDILYPKNMTFKGDRKITLFIPDVYRSMQIWKSCNFLRQCDLYLTTRSYLNTFIEHNIPFSYLEKRYALDTYGKHEKKHDLSELKCRISSCSGENIDNNSEISVPFLGRSSTDMYRLVNLPQMKKHRSDKSLPFNCFNFKQRKYNYIRFPCFYPPSVIYCNILNKLSLFSTTRRKIVTK